MNPAQETIREIARQTYSIGIGHTQSRLRNEGYRLSAKDMKLARERARISMSLAVYGKATVRTNGAETERSVRLYDTLPTWWNRAAADQRAAWLLAYFSKQLHLESGDELLTVRIPI